MNWTEDGGAPPYDYAKAPRSHDDFNIDIERLYDFSEAGKIQLIRSKGQLLSEEYVPEGIEVKAYVPQDIYGRL